MSPNLIFNARDEDINFRAQDFASFVKTVALANGRASDFEHIATAHGVSPSVRALLREKSVAVTGDVLADVDGTIAGFLESLRSAGLFDAVAGDFLQVPLNTRVTAAIAMQADANAETAPMAAANINLDGAGLAFRKCAAFLAISNEVMRLASAAANSFLLNELRRAVSAATDLAFVTDILATTTPESSTGSDAASAREDIGALLDSVPTGSSSRLHLAMPSALAKALSVMPSADGGDAFPGMSWRGGTIAGVPTHVTDALGAGEVLLFDAAAIAANVGSVDAGVTRHANLTVTDDSSPPEPITVSAFQKNLIGLRIVRSFGFTPLCENFAASISGAAWKAEAQA